MTHGAREKLAEARRRWRKTIGEHVLRALGIGLALAALALGVHHGFDTDVLQWDSGGPPSPYTVKRVPVKVPGPVLLIVSEVDSAAEGFAEAIRSYFGLPVTMRTTAGLDTADLDGARHLVVYFNANGAGSRVPSHVLAAALEGGLTVNWFGAGAAEVASLLGLVPFEEASPTRIPSNSLLVYKGTAIDASGLPFVPGYPTDSGAEVQVVAVVRLHDVLQRPAVLRSARATYVAFDPFPRNGAPLALVLAIDVLADSIGQRSADPRVIFRLEDVNPADYGVGDTRFTRAAQQLLDAGIFVHVAITPTMVDTKGRFVADLRQAPEVLAFLQRNRSSTAAVMHGARHHRDDPRNAGKASGDAHEFFFDDDQTMGGAAARRFARERLEEGQRAMADANLAPLMFEAPHLEMSPAQERVARSMFPVMMHPPIFFGSRSEQFTVQVPWITERQGTVYAPGDVGYVDALDERSVEVILRRLEQLALILPDPLVVVFYHPFMIDKPGREEDLARLIGGMRLIGYRSVSLLDEVRPQSATTH